MNQTQVKHALQRAKEIYDRKVKAANEKWTVPAVHLTEEEKLNALENGEFRIKIAKGTVFNFAHYVVFPAETPKKANTVKLFAALQSLKTKYDKLVDELILGDNLEALRMLKEYEESK